MKNKHTTNGKGFTLIELVIAMVILSILSMVAFPGYQATVRKSRRVDGKAALLKVAQALERCYTEYNRYDDNDGSGEPACADVETSASPTVSFITDDNDHNINGEGYYTITSVDNDGTETLTSNSFTLFARPTTKSHQDLDADCTEFSLDSIGRKRASGVDSTHCW